MAMTKYNTINHHHLSISRIRIKDKILSSNIMIINKHMLINNSHKHNNNNLITNKITKLCLSENQILQKLSL